MAISANVPYAPTQGVVSAEGVPANDESRVHANPEEFGGQVGAAVKQVGSSAEELGEKYLQMATEAKAENTIANQFAPAAAKLKADFMAKQGIDAVKAEPTYVASLTNLRQQFLDQSGGPYEKQILSNWMSRHSAQEVDGASRYAAEQQNKYEDQSHNAMLGTLSTSMAMNYNNSSVIDDSLKTGEALILKRGIDTGKEQDHEIPYLQSQFRGSAIKSTIDSAIYNGDVPAAKRLFDTYKSQLDPKDLKDLDVSLAPKIADYDSRNISEHVLGHWTDRYNWDVYGHGLHADNNKSSDSSIDWTMQHEGGFVANDSGKGPTKFGINKEANPDVDVENLTQDQAAKLMKDRYWTPVGADNMSPSMARVAFDTSVNMGVGKAKELVQAADGNPQTLIDMRRQEYVRLATENPEKYGANLPGWNARLDDLQKTLGGGDIASNGKAIPSAADFYKANYSNILADARSQAERARPNDIDFIEKSETRTKQHMDSIIEQTNKANQANLDIVTRASNGDFTKGTQPGTIDELTNSDPKVKAAWNDLQVNDPKAAATIAKSMVGTKQDGKLGSGFSYLQQAAYKGQLNVNDMLYHVGNDLTQEGFNQLKTIIKPSVSADERSENDQMATFLKQGHEQILHSSLFSNTPEAENAYQAWFASVSKQIQEKRKDNAPLSTLVDLNSKDYVGKNLSQFMIPLSKQLQDRADRINQGLQTAPQGNIQQRLPGETPESYLARVK